MATMPKLSPKQYKLLVKAVTVAFHVQNMTGDEIDRNHPKLWEILRKEEWGNFWYQVMVDIAANHTESRYYKAIVNA